MPVENTAGLIANFNILWPEDDNVKSEGDNHIRLVKKTVQDQWVNVNTSVVASSTELNYLQGLTGNIQDQLDAIAFAQGTAMVFVQASPPTGWAIDATKNDRVIRVNSASGGLTGGGWQITGLSLGDHTHNVDLQTGASNGPNSSAGSASMNYSEATHTHNVSGLTQINTDANVVSDGTWRPAYVDAIIATKL